jgi:quercetin dioxygenase-like cupin family protein
VLQLNLRKGVISSPHIYNDHDVVFYILSGDCTFLLGDRFEQCTKGALVFIPKGTTSPHRVDSETALMLNIHTPGGFDEAFDSWGRRSLNSAYPRLATRLRLSRQTPD